MLLTVHTGLWKRFHFPTYQFHLNPCNVSSQQQGRCWAECSSVPACSVGCVWGEWWSLTMKGWGMKSWGRAKKWLAWWVKGLHLSEARTFWLMERFFTWTAEHIRNTMQVCLWKRKWSGPGMDSIPYPGCLFFISGHSFYPHIYCHHLSDHSRALILACTSTEVHSTKHLSQWLSPLHESNIFMLQPHYYTISHWKCQLQKAVRKTWNKQTIFISRGKCKD